jgi:hypothetical protein
LFLTAHPSLRCWSLSFAPITKAWRIIFSFSDEKKYGVEQTRRQSSIHLAFCTFPLSLPTWFLFPFRSSFNFNMLWGTLIYFRKNLPLGKECLFCDECSVKLQVNDIQYPFLKLWGNTTYRHICECVHSSY